MTPRILAFAVLGVWMTGSALAFAADPPPPKDNPIDDDERDPLEAGLELLAGWGSKDDVVIQRLPGQNGSGLPTYEYHRAEIRTTSLLLYGRYEFKSGLALGLRFPITPGRVVDPGPSLSGFDAVTPGGLELSVDYSKDLNKESEIRPELALVLPTAYGKDPPAKSDTLALESGNFDRTGVHAYYINLGAAYAGGLEDFQLYNPGRLSTVPKVTYIHTLGEHGRVSGYAKIPLMFDVVNPDPHSLERFRMEAVVGGRIGYQIRFFEMAFRAWVDIPIVAVESTREVTIAIEPEVRIHITPDSRFYVGGIIPLVGRYSVSQNEIFGGLRAGFNVAF